MTRPFHRTRTNLIATVALALVLAGCSAPQPAPTSAGSEPTPTPTSTPTPEPTYSCPPTPIEATITYELEQVSGGVQVAVATNLPDGAELMTSFFREGSYFGQDVQVIQDGRVVAGPFSDDGAPLRGAYDLSLTLSIAPTQPDETQDCIGPHGENLTGPLVQLDQFGEQWVVLDVPVIFE